MKKFFNLFIALFLFATAHAQDSYGQDFWIAAPSNFSGNTLDIYITAQTTATVNVSVPGIGYSNSVIVTGGTLQTVILPLTAQVTGTGTFNLGIHITSNVDVTVYFMNERPYSTDAYLALPVDALGVDYMALCYTPTLGYPSQLTIVATENGTTISINSGASIALNQGQVYQLSSGSSDFTGYTVTSNKPIAVFASVQCVNIPIAAVVACDHIIEQIPPTTAWGTSFVATSLATRTGGDIYRFLAKENGTQVSINGSLVSTLNAGQFYQADLASNAVYSISSSKPILVGQYSKGSNADGVVADPFFALVPPDDQFITNYIISSGTSNIPNNFVNITSKTSNTSAVLVDNVAVPSGVWTVVSGTSFSTTRVPLSNGIHTISSTLPVGVFAYGFGNYDSYGYLGGQSFSPVATVSQMSLNLTATTAYQAQQQCFVATVLDQNNNPVAGVLVNFTVAGATTTAGFGTTNAQGQVTLCYTTCLPGNDVFTATIAGLSSSVNVTVLPTTFNVAPSSLNASIGVQACATATVLDGLNQPVPNAVVSFSVSGANSAAVQNVLTNAFGIAQLCYTPANAGNDVMTVSYGCALGAPSTVNITVTGGGIPCPPGPSISFSLSGLNANPWGNQGANNPAIFYYGLVDAKRINATITGGNGGPYSYQWTSSLGPNTLMPRAYYPPTSMDLFRPTGPVTVTLTLTDLNNGCQYSGSVNVGWTDQYFCYVQNNIWYIRLCQNGQTVCVPWATGRTLLRNSLATLGACTPKTDVLAVNTGLNLYPNPSNGLVTIENLIASSGNGTIEVLDVNGRTLYTEFVQLNEGVFYHTIDLGILPNGIYVVRLISDSEFATERIQILR